MKVDIGALRKKKCVQAKSAGVKESLHMVPVNSVHFTHPPSDPVSAHCRTKPFCRDKTCRTPLFRIAVQTVSQVNRGAFQKCRPLEKPFKIAASSKDFRLGERLARIRPEFPIWARSHCSQSACDVPWRDGASARPFRSWSWIACESRACFCASFCLVGRSVSLLRRPGLLNVIQPRFRDRTER